VGGLETCIILLARPKCGLLNQIHARSISCQCASIPKFASERATQRTSESRHQGEIVDPGLAVTTIKPGERRSLDATPSPRI
jgi:hypothetical protein